LANEQNKKPLISVIIPTYNSEATIRKSLKSIAEQKSKDYELIIVDGVSKDNTINIIKEYEGLIERLKWLSEPDKNIYDAMNKGIDLASGEWLYFLGSDDYLINEYVFSNIDAVIKEKQPDFLYGNVIFGSTNTVYQGKISLKDLYFLNLCHQGIFMRKQVILKHGKFDLQYSSFADWELNIKIFRDTTLKIEYIDQVVAYYDINGTSSKNTDTSQKIREAMIDQYFNLRNRVLLYLSEKLRKFSEYLIPKK
jgi:glycosyltransferase involved in cell wall biosynthesis